MTSRMPPRPILFGASLLAFLGTAQPRALAQSCGATITTNLTLTSDLDLTGCTGTALTIGADGITIDGQGHTILAPDASVVIGLSGRTGVSIVNLVISGATPIQLSSSNGNVISGVVAPGSDTGFGIGVLNSSGNQITACIVTGRQYGVRLDGTSSANTIQGNTFSGNATAVLGAGSGSGNQILNNDLSAATSYSIDFGFDNDIAISGNIYTGSANGIFLGSMNGITLTNPDLSQVAGTALSLVFVHNSTFTDIPANAATIPMQLSSSNNNRISQVHAAGSATGVGIAVLNSSGTRIEGCTVTGRQYGVRLDGTSSANTIQGNTFSGNVTAVLGAGSGNGNQILNNDLSAATSYSIDFGFDNAIAISGNIYTGSANGIALSSMDGVSLSGADLNQVTGTALSLVFVHNSTFTSIFSPADGIGISLSSSNGNHFSDVDVSADGPVPLGVGFVFVNSSNNTIESARAQYRNTGIDLHGSSNLVHCSVITHNNTGIHMNAGFVGNAVHQNQISDNALYGANSDAPLDAENNYWGDPDGPAPSGSGNAIAGAVDADPFFASLTVLFGACPGIVNSPPTVACSGGGTYQVGSDTVILHGSVTDFEGQQVTFESHEGSIVYASGTVLAATGGSPVDLPLVTKSTGLPHNPTAGVIGLGSHTITLTVSDGVNDPVECVVQVEVVDTQAPTLAPASVVSTLWPPDHQMVAIVIAPNAFDNSGGDVTLEVTVASSEPVDAPGMGDGTTSPDFSTPVVAEDNGTITLQLRAERDGKGPGRTYTVTITATDEFGNAATAVLVFRVPHDMG
jgi:parallel beta-helix repeat protein